jgi:hypothetical protein
MCQSCVKDVLVWLANVLLISMPNCNKHEIKLFGLMFGRHTRVTPKVMLNIFLKIQFLF